MQRIIKEYQGKTFVDIFWDDQFVGNALMKSLFNQCFAVLMPYKNAEASSGILGHAVAANKKVIITGKGLLKELIKENELGVLLNNVTPSEVAQKMVELLLLKNQGDRKKNVFLKERTPTIFAERLLLK